MLNFTVGITTEQHDQNHFYVAIDSYHAQHSPNCNNYQRRVVRFSAVQNLPAQDLNQA